MIDMSKIANLGAQADPTSPASAAIAALAAVSRPAARSFVPPPPRHVDDRHFDLIAATLAGGMIAATGREHTAAEAFKVFRTVRDGLNYEPGPAPAAS